MDSHIPQFHVQSGTHEPSDTPHFTHSVNIYIPENITSHQLQSEHQHSTRIFNLPTVSSFLPVSTISSVSTLIDRSTHSISHSLTSQSGRLQTLMSTSGSKGHLCCERGEWHRICPAQAKRSAERSGGQAKRGGEAGVIPQLQRAIFISLCPFTPPPHTFYLTDA